MREWSWGHWYEKWALYVERPEGMAGPILIVNQVPPDEAQFIVDALNEKEQRPPFNIENGIWDGIFLGQPLGMWYALDAAAKARNLEWADVLRLVQNAPDEKRRGSLVYKIADGTIVREDKL